MGKIWQVYICDGLVYGMVRSRIIPRRFLLLLRWSKGMCLYVRRSCVSYGCCFSSEPLLLFIILTYIARDCCLNVKVVLQMQLVA